MCTSRFATTNAKYSSCLPMKKNAPVSVASWHFFTRKFIELLVTHCNPELFNTLGFITVGETSVMIDQRKVNETEERVSVHRITMAHRGSALVYYKNQNLLKNLIEELVLAICVVHHVLAQEHLCRPAFSGKIL